MATNTSTRKQTDRYFDLVKQFPLKRIRDDAQLRAAAEIVDTLLKEKLTAAAEDYLDVLTDLIELYEDQHEPIPDSSEAEVLRELMRSNGLSQLRLAEKVRISQSTLSAVMTGARSFTKGQIVKLSRLFNVSPAAFLQVPRPSRRK